MVTVTFGSILYASLIAAMGAAANGFETPSMVLLIPGAVFEIMFGLTLALRGRRIISRSLRNKGT